MDEAAITLAKDDDLKSLGLSIGTILKIKVWFSRKTELNTLIKNGNRLTNSRKRKGAEVQTLYIGWFHFNGQKFSQVRSSRGGGSRSLKMNKSSTLKEVLGNMMKCYWPRDMKPGFGRFNLTDFDIRNFEHKEVDHTITLKE